MLARLRGRRGDDGYMSGAAVTASVVAAIIAIITIIFLLVGWLGGYVKTDGGHVAVIRNGGPFDNNKVRSVIPPASSRTWTGFWSHTHEYPSQQRFYTISANADRGDRSGVDVSQNPSSDGVELGVEGTIYFTLNTDPTAMITFDNKYGTRKFTDSAGNSFYPWEGDEGWRVFLDQIVRPVIDNDLREEIGNFKCEELISSCAYVHNTSGKTAVNAISSVNNGANIAKVQSAINTSLQQDLTETLGGDYFKGITFRLSGVKLPTSVQEAVDATQAQFAANAQAQAKVQQAAAEARANRQRQRGYVQCPACAVIDELKAIPSNVTTFAPGSGFAITAK